MPLTYIPPAEDGGPEWRLDLDQVVAAHFVPSLDADAIELHLYVGMHVVTLVGPPAFEAWQRLSARDVALGDAPVEPDAAT